MEIIALLCPALLSVKIRFSRDREIEKNVVSLIIEWGIYALINIFCTEIIITYLLGVDGVTVDALNSFSFFIKHTVIACVLAIIVPYIQEIIRKYTKVSFMVDYYEKENKDSSKNS